LIPLRRADMRKLLFAFIMLFTLSNTHAQSIDQLYLNLKNAPDAYQANIVFESLDKVLREKESLEYKRLIGIGKRFMESRTLTQTIYYFLKAISLDPQEQAGYLLIAQTYYLLGDIKNAQKMAEKCIEINARAINCLYGVALMNYKERLYGKSMETLLRIKEIYPFFPKIDYYIKLTEGIMKRQGAYLDQRTEPKEVLI
jgi:tetratricopeptide (TPR) repeat protein